MRYVPPRPALHRLALRLALFAAITVVACDADQRTPSSAPVSASESISFPAKQDLAAASEPSFAPNRGVAGGRAASAQPDVLRMTLAGGATASRMLIRRADVSIRVDSLEIAMAALRHLSAALGGAVGNVAVSAGDYQVRSATLELRVPADRFDEAMSGLSPIGKVEQSAVSAEDVGEEYVDVTARVANAKRLEARLVVLLATRTGKLDDVLAVERELARVREEIERYEGRIRYLGTRVATSTISVTVSEPVPVVGVTPGRSVLGLAFVNAWRNFVGLVARIIESLGVLIPTGLLAWLATRMIRARRRRQAA